MSNLKEKMRIIAGCKMTMSETITTLRKSSIFISSWLIHKAGGVRAVKAFIDDAMSGKDIRVACSTTSRINARYGQYFE